MDLELEMAVVPCYFEEITSAFYAYVRILIDWEIDLFDRARENLLISLVLKHGLRSPA